MKVAELIEILTTLDPKLEVRIASSSEEEIVEFVEVETRAYIRPGVPLGIDSFVDKRNWMTKDVVILS
jgi:hypothetical protein